MTSADEVRPHVQTVTTYAADFDEVQLIELDADDVDEWQYVYTDVAQTIYESQVRVTGSQDHRYRNRFRDAFKEASTGFEIKAK